MNDIIKAKPGPKRKSKRVQDEQELLAMLRARQDGLSWRAISRKFGLVEMNGMTARNAVLRAQRRFWLVA